MYLENIKNPKDLKKLNIKELEALCDEIRQRILSVSQNNGGHLASSLGAVEAIVALYYVFDFPKDKIIFDVGHQAYAHKILSERNEVFETIRKEGGLSGFPNIFESEYDAFSVGHAGTSISAALGYCKSRDLLKEDYFVIAFVGDASFVNGENLEALFSSEQKPDKFLVVLNDNGMSISKNNNGLYKMLSKISTKKSYSRFMRLMDKLFGWNFIGRFLKGVKAAFKRSLDSYGMLDTLGIKYVGAFDGHKIKLLIDLFKNFKGNPRATLFHLKTKKGKGYDPAEKESEKYHVVSKNMCLSENSFSSAVSWVLCELFEKDERFVAITAATARGTGVEELAKKYPERVFDVGISEEYSVTYAAGMAIAGLKPIVCIYSTFMQRAYDQIIGDVCLQNLPVIFMLDRAGFVGTDGVTHQGLYDISYLSHIPNISIFAPKDTEELKTVVSYAAKLNSPVAIRYPNGVNEEFSAHSAIDENNLWEIVGNGSDGAIGSENVALCVGPRMIRLAQEVFAGKDVTIVNARSIKPLDEKMLDSIADRRIVTLEENSLIGGFGSLVCSYYSKKNVRADVKSFGAEDRFIEHASAAAQIEKHGISRAALEKAFER